MRALLQAVGEGRRLPTRLFWLAPFLIFLLHSAWLSHAQGHGAVDDAWIAFRYVQQWRQGHGLVFNPGEWVEGYSSLAWIMVLAGLNALGLELLSAALLAGVLCGLGVLLLSWRFAWRLSGRFEVGAVAALLLALDGGFVRWAVDGLETQLFALFLLLGTQTLWDWSSVWASNDPSGTGRALLRRAGLVGLWLGLASLTRPEGLGFVGLGTLFCLAQTVSGPKTRWAEGAHSALALIGGASCVILPQLLWRHATYGEWVANTALLKVEPGFVSTIRGVRYVIMFAWERLPLWLGVLLAGGIRKKRGQTAPLPARARALLALQVGGMTASTVLVGGDWMGWSRFYVPVLSFLYCWAASILIPVIPDRSRAPDWAGMEGGEGARIHIPTPFLAGLVAVGLFISASVLGERPRLLKAEQEHRERTVISDYLKQHAHPSDVILTEELGEIPFQTGLVALDVYGLIDKHIAKEGEWDADSPPGHQKTDLNYSLSHRPAWLVMASFYDTWKRNASATAGSPVRFPALQQYQPVPLSLPEGRLELYRRR